MENKKVGISNSIKGMFKFMNEEACYYKKENELRLDYNVKIEYLISEEFEDGTIVQTVLIPKKIYDVYYVREDRIVK